MSPLQRIAMGLVIVVLRAPFPVDPTPSWATYDVLADPVGWVLVLMGVFALTRVDETYSGVRVAAVIAAAASVPLWFPQVTHRLEDSAAWFFSLPQLVFCLLLARQIGARAGEQRPPDLKAGQRFGVIGTGFILVAILPVLVLGGGIRVLQEPAAVVSLLVNVALIWSLFSFHRRAWLGGPGPLEVQPTKPAGPSDPRGEHKPRKR